MDFIDIQEGRFNQTYTGKYYALLPYLVEQAPAAALFDYEYVDTDSRSYRQILQNVTTTEAADVTIKTREQLSFKPGQHISLEDGRLFAIISVSVDRSSASKEAARLSPLPVGSEIILRLVEVDNPRGL